MFNNSEPITANADLVSDVAFRVADSCAACINYEQKGRGFAVCNCLDLNQHKTAEGIMRPSVPENGICNVFRRKPPEQDQEAV